MALKCIILCAAIEIFSKTTLEIYQNAPFVCAVGEIFFKTTLEMHQNAPFFRAAVEFFSDDDVFFQIFFLMMKVKF